MSASRAQTLVNSRGLRPWAKKNAIELKKTPSGLKKALSGPKKALSGLKKALSGIKKALSGLTGPCWRYGFWKKSNWLVPKHIYSDYIHTYIHTKLSPVALYTHAELRHKLLQLLSYSKNVSNGIVPTLAAEGIWSTCSSSL